MTLQEHITKTIQRLKSRDPNDYLYHLYQAYTEELYNWSTQNLIPLYRSSQELNSLVRHTCRLFALLRVLREVLTSIESSEERLKSLGFPSPGLFTPEQQQRLLFLLCGSYRTKGSKSVLESLVKYIYRSTEYKLVEYVLGEYSGERALVGVLDDKQLPSITPISVVLQDPLWDVPLDSIDLVPARTPYISLIRDTLGRNLLWDALVGNYVLVESILNPSRLDTGETLEVPEFPLKVSYVGAYVFANLLMYLINKYSTNFTSSPLLDPNLRVYSLLNVETGEVTREDIKSVLVSNIVLDQRLQSLYDVIVEYFYAYWNQLDLISETSLFTHVSMYWREYSAHLSAYVFDLCRRLAALKYTVYFLVFAHKAVQVFDTSYNISENVSYDEFYTVVLPKFLSVCTIPTSTYVTMIGASGGVLQRMEALLSEIAPRLYTLYNLIKSDLETYGPSAQKLSEVTYLLGSIMEVLSTTKNTTNTLTMIAPKESQQLDLLLSFYKPHYVRVLGEVPTYVLSMQSPIDGLLVTKSSLDHIEETIYMDSSYWVGYYRYNVGFTLPKRLRTELFNLDQLWTYTDQSLHTDGPSFVLVPRTITRTIPITYDPNRSVSPVWELRGTEYAPVDVLPIIEETEEYVTIGATYRNEPITYYMSQISTTQDITNLVLPILGVVRGRDMYPYKITFPPLDSYPQDVKSIMSSYTKHELSILESLIRGSSSLYARYGDDIVVIVEMKNGVQEYARLVAQI